MNRLISMARGDMRPALGVTEPSAIALAAAAARSLTREAPISLTIRVNSGIYKNALPNVYKYNADALIVMLGTNDLLISPPPMKRGAWVPDGGLVEESKNLARQYEGLAKRRGIWFVDAGAWDIALAYDGVHFTEEGHARFAEGLASRLEVIL